MRSDERQNKLDELQKKLFELRTQAVTEKLENTKLIHNTRRDIARVKTITTCGMNSPRCSAYSTIIGKF